MIEAVLSVWIKIFQINKVFIGDVEKKNRSFLLAAPSCICGIFVRNAILLVHGVLISLAAQALDLDAEKARIRQEVVLETPDQSLVDALTEIRFKREVLPQANAKKKLAAGPAVTVALGRENSLGYEYTWKNSMHGLRLEFNWQEPRSENTMFDGALYGERTRYQSVGAYYVISPFENGFRVMTGWRLERDQNDICRQCGRPSQCKWQSSHAVATRPFELSFFVASCNALRWDWFCHRAQ